MRSTPRKPEAARGSVFATGLRYGKALNMLVEDGDAERETRKQLRDRARSARLRTRDGKKKGTVKSYVRTGAQA